MYLQGVNVARASFQILEKIVASSLSNEKLKTFGTTFKTEQFENALILKLEFDWEATLLLSDSEPKMLFSMENFFFSVVQNL